MPDPVVEEPAAQITRPNGKTYRPRTPGLQAHAWPNEHRGVDGEGYWYGSEMEAADPRPGWFRNGFSCGEPMWVDDPVRGRPGVMWEAIPRV